MFAYGPAEIASIQYLQENEVAVCVTSPEELAEGLRNLLSSEELRERVVKKALALANKNHDITANVKMIREVLEKVKAESEKS